MDNDETLDAFLRRAVRMRAVSARTARELNKIISEADGDTVAALAKRLRGVRSLETTIEAVNEIRRDAHGRLSGKMVADLTPMIKGEAEFVSGFGRARKFGRATLAGIVSSVLTRPADGLTVDGHLAALQLSDTTRTARLVRSAVTAGQGVGQVIGGLRQTVFPRTAKYVLGTARTIYAHSQATVLDNVASTDLDDLRGLRWTSVLDGKTSAICRARSGEVYQPFEGPRPPAHFNYRSVMVPVFINGGDVIEPSYEQWLSRQPRGFVEEVMGKRKGDIFRSGDISLDRFVDSAGRELRVDELPSA
ncbi:MAG: hypothetical protein ABJ079_08155 [Marinomonas sp.]